MIDGIGTAAADENAGSDGGAMTDERRFAEREPVASRGAGAPTKLSINVSQEIGQRLRRLGFEQRLSESSIVEVALHLLFRQGSDDALGALLRENGASLRRRR